MINLIAQHKFDHYQAVIIAARYGHLDFLKLIYQSRSFPYASYSLKSNKVGRAALKAAITNHQYHITEWFAQIGLIDNYLCPRTIYTQPISQCDQYYLHHDILDWLLNIVGGEFPEKHSSVTVSLSLSLSTFSTELIEWYERNRDKFPHALTLRLAHICLHGRLDILAQIHHLISDNIDDLLPDIMHGGNLATIQWFYHKEEYHDQFQWLIDTMIDYATLNDHFHILKRLVDTVGAKVNNKRIANRAIANGNIQILEWLWVRNALRRYDTDVIEIASTRSYIHVLAWLRTHELLPRGEDYLVLR